MALLFLMLLALCVGFIAVEFALPARALPEQPFWRLRGILAFAVYVAIAFTAPLLWDAALAQNRLFDASGLPLWAQIVGGLLVAEFGMHLWHRTMHANDFLWRWLHQTHHSAERIDVWGAFWFHPFDMVGWTLLGSLSLVFVFGVQPEAAIVVNLTMISMNLFTHLNVRTPQWLGYLIARPEMHAAHHERGLHHDNYCDLPVIDMLFGTWRNPRDFPAANGFEDGDSMRLRALLLGRKIA